MEYKMLAAPWEATQHPCENWIYAVNGSEDGGDIICDQPSMEDSAKRWWANSQAIVSAVNGTYGCGINPEAVPDLKKCLEELLAQFEKVVDPKYTLDYMLIREAKAVIEKCKL